MPRLAVTLPLVLTVVLGVTGCAALGGNGFGANPGASEAACPTALASVASPSPTPTPTPAPTVDPAVAKQLRGAIKAVRAVDGVATAGYDITLVRNDVPDPTCPSRTLDRHSFTALFTVAMQPGASTDAAAEVPATMAEHLAWTAVTLALTDPAASGRVATRIDYNGTFDQTIPRATTRAVAAGLASIASTPHVTGVTAAIPYTMRVDYGSLTVGADTSDPAILAGVRTVIDGTAFRDTTLHGAFGNGAKP